MSHKRNYRYLNKDTGLMYSPLYRTIKAGQNRAPANQWANIINSLKSKGVKESEINDSGILAHIATLDGPVSKADLLGFLESGKHLIKEIDLTRPQYKRYSYAKHGTDYLESLYVLAGEDDFLADKLLDLQFELEDLDFYPERLMENPLLAHQLYEQEQEIKQKLSEVNIKSRTSVSHWSDQKDPDTGKPIDSLLFHSRTSIQEDGKTFFVEEIQSDWAQRGRQRNWEGIPKAPWVTNTDLWASLAFRRLMQRAADNPAIEKFAWVTGDYRNGGNFIAPDGLNDFYIKVVGKAVNRILSGTGEKANFQKVQLGEKEVELPSFTMTDNVRAKLKEAQPLYSRDHAMRELSEHALAATSSQLKEAVASAKHMLGSSASIKLLVSLTDESNHAVSGRFLGDCIEVSLSGQNPAQALAHESWHYAYTHLLTPSERAISDNAFSNQPDNPLLDRLIDAMHANGFSNAAIAQTVDPQEAVAHAFSLWMEGKFELSGDTAPLLEATFTHVSCAFDALQAQVVTTYERSAQPVEPSRAESDLLALFEQLRAEQFAHRRHPTLSAPSA